MELVTHEDVDGRPDRRITHRIDGSALCSLCRIEEDSLALVEMWQDTLEELKVAGECAEPGCIQLAVPDGPPFVADRDQDGIAVYLRKWRCAVGYPLELR